MGYGVDANLTGPYRLVNEMGRVASTMRPFLFLLPTSQRIADYYCVALVLPLHSRYCQAVVTPHIREGIMPRRPRTEWNPKEMAKWQEHRTAVKQALKNKGKSPYWLHKQLADRMSQNLLYSYLRGDTGISMENAEAINRVLGIKYTDE